MANKHKKNQSVTETIAQKLDTFQEVAGVPEIKEEEIIEEVTTVTKEEPKPEESKKEFKKFQDRTFETIGHNFFL